MKILSNLQCQKIPKGIRILEKNFLSVWKHEKKLFKISFLFGEKFHSAEKGPLCSSNAFFQTENIHQSEGGTLWLNEKVTQC